MIEQDFIMLIMNCKKYEKKALFQKQTWLQSIPAYLKYYHVIGDETLETTFAFDEGNSILWVKAADDYNSLKACTTSNCKIDNTIQRCICIIIC